MSQYGPDLQSGEQKVSAWGGLVKMITEPGATFAGFGSQIPILPGYVVQMVLTLISSALILPATLALMEQQMAANPVPAEVMTITKWAGIGGGLFGALISPWMAGVFTALLALFFGQFHGGAKNFTQYLGLIGYARIPVALGAVAQGVMVLLTGSVTNPGLSLGILAPEGSSAYLVGVLGVLNPFTLWYYAVLAIGFGVLHNGSWRKGLGLVTTMLIIAMLMGLAGGAFQGLNPGMQ